MSVNEPFDRELAGFLEAVAPKTAPAGLHDGVIERARRSRQRPVWLVAARGGTSGRSGVLPGLTWRRACYLLVAMALVLAAMLVALAVGAFRSHAVNPLLGGNGAIVYVLQDLSGGMHMIGADGVSRSAVSTGTCPATYSPDGSHLTYWTGDSPELLIAEADGSSPRRLGIFGEGPHPEDRFALSPDGTRFAWIKRVHGYEASEPDGSTTTVGWDDELWVLPVSGGTGVRIVAISGARNEVRLLPAWSPDGHRIAYLTFVSSATESHRTSIDVIDVDGSNDVRLTSRPASGLGGMSWSPDSRFIAYAGLPDAPVAPSTRPRDKPSGDSAPEDIFVIGADGTTDRNLTNTSANEAGPQWSPDGSHLAFRTSLEAVGDRLTTVRMNGAEATGLPSVGPTVSSYFSWSPDATKLLLLQESPTESTDRLGRTRSTILSVDPEFDGPSQTLVEVDRVVLCAPSWQRLDP